MNTAAANDFNMIAEGRITIEDFIDQLEHPDNANMEFINGYIVMMAGNASGNHHRISGYIFRKIGNYLEGKTCEVFQDINVYMFKESIRDCKNVYQPDVMVGCERDKVTNRGYEGIPEFVVEVVSKSSALYDYSVKCQQYLRFGVKEYWVVDMFKKQVVVYLNDGEGLPEIHRYGFNDTVKLSVFDGLSIDFSEILKIVSI